jgi:hypothetical protein
MIWICEHGNEVPPDLGRAIFNMPDSWYKKVAANLDPDTCLFVSEATALSEQAKKLSTAPRGLR